MAGPSSINVFEFDDVQGVRVVLKAEDNTLTVIKEGDTYSWFCLDASAQSYSTSGGVGFVSSHTMAGLISFLQFQGAASSTVDFTTTESPSSQQAEESRVQQISGGAFEDGTPSLMQPEPDTATVDEAAKRQGNGAGEGYELGASLEESSRDERFGGEPNGEHVAQGRSLEHTETQSGRLEALIAHQNALLLRQLEIAEKVEAKQSSAILQRQGPRDILKSLDSDTKAIFIRWRTQFRSMVATYVAQSKKLSKLQVASTNGELVAPFSKEAAQSWDWPQSYRTIAQPLPGDGCGKDSNTACVRCADDLVDASGAVDSFDVCKAFAELRHKHAWHLQNFVLEHQDACVRTLIQDLSLDSQICNLQGQISQSTSEHNVMNPPTMPKETLDLQARAFVEAVHRAEMEAAEAKMKEKPPCPVRIHFALRIALVVLLIVGIATMSHEILMHLLAFLFALGCGLALLWEDVVVSIVRFLLGSSLQRLERTCAQPAQIGVNQWNPLW